jgi:ketosteroid isomerase-like protein
MIDEVAIQQTINTYTVAASRADWPQLLSTFTADGIWEVPARGMRLQGQAAIQPAMAGFVAQMAYFVQVNAPAVIKVDGETATARSVIRECGKFADRDEALEVLGIYEDELVRTAQGWKFARRVFRSAGLHTFPLSPKARVAGLG